jgi:hypothetical protein
MSRRSPCAATAATWVELGRSPTNDDQVSYELKAIQNFFWLADRCGLVLPEDSQI